MFPASNPHTILLHECCDWMNARHCGGGILSKHDVCGVYVYHVCACVCEKNYIIYRVHSHGISVYSHSKMWVDVTEIVNIFT